jgi:ribonuclease P protein component
LNYKVTEGGGPVRFAVIAAKKTLPLAVQRNRAKRISRALFRSQGERFPVGTELVLVVRSTMLRRRFADLEKIMAQAAQRIAELKAT